MTSGVICFKSAAKVRKYLQKQFQIGKNKLPRITKLQNYILYFRCCISNLQIVNIKILSYINIFNINIR